jgi:hypothetical protein
LEGASSGEASIMMMCEHRHCAQQRVAERDANQSSQQPAADRGERDEESGLAFTPPLWEHLIVSCNGSLHLLPPKSSYYEIFSRAGTEFKLEFFNGIAEDQVFIREAASRCGKSAVMVEKDFWCRGRLQCCLLVQSSATN